MKQSKGRNGDLKTEHKKKKNATNNNHKLQARLVSFVFQIAPGKDSGQTIRMHRMHWVITRRMS